ncbi:MAG: thiazole biosynthesis adenylyltransferase ThiF, partial [Candidatus Brocadiales bacterium]
ETAGILAPAAKLVASIQATEALKILTGNLGSLIYGLVNVDLWKGTFQKVDTRTVPSTSCPACQKGEYEFLNAKSFSLTTTLCGSNAVQITPANGSKADLSALSQRLQSIPGMDNISHSPYLLRFRCVGARHAVPLHWVVFPDGRAILFGTQDPSLARTLYSQYMGL